LRSRLNPLPRSQIQARLLALAAVFLLLYSVILTLAPAARARSWSVEYRWSHWLGFATWALVFLLAHILTCRRLPEADPYLLPLAAILTGWGILTIYRLVPSYGLRQTAWLLVSGLVFLFGLRLSPELRFLRRYKYLWLTSSLVLTALTVVLGTNPLGIGPRMWLGCCGIYLQPSEPLKLLLIVYLAAYLADRQSYLLLASTRNPGSPAPLLPLLAPTLIMTGLALALLVVQRDLGTATMFLFLYAAVVYVASGRKRILLTAFFGLCAAALAGYWLFDVVRVRIDAWLNPWIDPSGRSYQIVQSLLAIANGGLFGRGPGMGSPGVVPVAHSDLIFSAIAEEVGLAGIMVLLLLVAFLAYRGLLAAFYASDAYRRYLAAGLTAYLAGQALLIIGGSLRLVPLTGITLPFVSYGGSSLLVSFLSLLFLLHISNHTVESPASLPRPASYLQFGAFLFAGVTAAALVTGWWAVYRSPDLLARTDNPRRAIADRFVRRGALMDRNYRPISLTTGSPGGLARRIAYPDLSNIVGYTDPTYGQAGLEASLDGYLRGMAGYPGLTIWWNHVLYGQPPPGLDIRLSLDLDLQRAADQQLGDHPGALVLLNAENGDILAMASHPTFDANQLAAQWMELKDDPGSPLLNRAVQGHYSPGDLETALLPQSLSDLKLNGVPKIRLPAGIALPPGKKSAGKSPLQMALAAAVISHEGIRPALSLVSAVNTPSSGWMILPAEDTPLQVIDPSVAEALANSRADKGKNTWQFTTVAENGPGQSVTWYLGGTLPGWQGTPFALALVLEENNPQLAMQIGQNVLASAMTP